MPFDPVPQGKTLTNYGKLFLDAADQIRQHGIAKGRLLDPSTGGMCMLGAMFKVHTGSAESFNQDFLEYDRWARGLGFPDASLMCSWNNHPERTVDQVVARFQQHAYV